MSLHFKNLSLFLSLRNSVGYWETPEIRDVASCSSTGVLKNFVPRPCTPLSSICEIKRIFLAADPLTTQSLYVHLQQVTAPKGCMLHVQWMGTWYSSSLLLSMQKKTPQSLRVYERVNGFDIFIQKFLPF